MRVYLDSSSFAKRFILEPGSEEVVEICAQATSIGLSVICVPEIFSALNRRRREGLLSPAQYDSAKRRVLNDIRDADIVDLTDSVICSSLVIIEGSHVRTLDALHVGSALEWGAELFVSSDHRQLVAAKKTGLKTQKV